MNNPLSSSPTTVMPFSDEIHIANNTTNRNDNNSDPMSTLFDMLPVGNIDLMAINLGPSLNMDGSTHVPSPPTTFSLPKSSNVLDATTVSSATLSVNICVPTNVSPKSTSISPSSNVPISAAITTTTNYPLLSPPTNLCVVSDATTGSPNSASIPLSSNLATATTTNIIIRPLSENARDGDGGNGGGDGDGNENGRGDQDRDKIIEMQGLLPSTKFRKNDLQRVVFVTKSDNDNLDDGFRWRKYGQKMVKDSPYPRNYYRCTTVGCIVKKRIERHPNDNSIVLTTYEGTHLHSCPVLPNSPRGTRHHTRRLKAVYQPVRAAADAHVVTGLGSRCIAPPPPQHLTLQQKLCQYQPLQQQQVHQPQPQLLQQQYQLLLLQQQPLLPPLGQQNVPSFYEEGIGGGGGGGGGGSNRIGSQQLQQQQYVQQVVDPVSFNPALPPWSTVIINSTPSTDYTMMSPPLVNVEDPYYAFGGAGPSTVPPSGHGDMFPDSGLLEDIVMSQVGRNP